MIPPELTRENGPYGSFLVGCPADAGHLVNYQLQLLMRHRPDWLIPGYLRYRSGQPQICLDVSDLKPLDEAYADQQRPPNEGCRLLAEICNLLAAGEDHLLPPAQFSLHPSLIYLDRDQSLKLAFWPCRDKDVDWSKTPDDLPALVRAIGRAFNWTDEQLEKAVSACQNGLSGLAACLAGNEVAPSDNDKPVDQAVTLDQATSASGQTADPATHKDKRTTTKKPENRPSPGKTIVAALHAVMIVFAVIVWLDFLPTARPFLLPALVLLALADLALLIRQHGPAGKKLLDRFLHNGEKPVPADDDEDQTVLLSAESDFRMAMLCEGQPGTAAEHEGIRAFILVEEFIVGRDPRKADLCLPDQAIGRMHARIVRRAGSFFICDLGSGNGTQLDGKRLAKHTEQLLPDHCLLQFANRTFYFVAD